MMEPHSAETEGPVDDRIVLIGGWRQWLPVVLNGLLALLLAYLAYQSRAAAEIAGASAFVLMALWLLCMFWTRLTMDREGLTLSALLLRRRRIAWADLRALYISEYYRSLRRQFDLIIEVSPNAGHGRVHRYRVVFRMPVFRQFSGTLEQIRQAAKAHGPCELSVDARGLPVLRRPLPEGPVFKAVVQSGRINWAFPLLMAMPVVAAILGVNLNWTWALITVPVATAMIALLLTDHLDLFLTREGLIYTSVRGVTEHIPWLEVVQVAVRVVARNRGMNALAADFTLARSSEEPRVLPFDFGTDHLRTRQHVQEMFAFIRQHSDLVEVNQAWGLPVLRRQQ